MKKGILIAAITSAAILLAGGTGFGIYQYNKNIAENGFVQEEQLLCTGQSLKPELGLRDTGGLSYTVQDTNIAEVSSDGTLTGKTIGATTLSAKNGIFLYKSTVTVRNHDNVAPTCEEEGYCRYCSALSGEKATGHTPSERTCVDDSVCSVCGKIMEEAAGHTPSTPACTEDLTCTVCGEILEQAKGHDFSEPTCTEAAKCLRCGAEGEDGPLGHSFSAADCTNPETCERCGITEGEPLGHKEGKVECLKPVTCEVCGEIIREAADHDYKAATCTKPETCKRCGATKGKALGHTADPPTCTSASVCKRCGTILQNKTDHLFVNTADAGEICAYCGVKKGASSSSGQASSSGQTPAPGQTSSSGQTSQSDYAAKVIELVNVERANRGLGALTADDALMKVAQLRSDECTVSYSHTRPDGTDCFTAYSQFGVSYRTAGENIAAGYATPESVVDGWMNSEPHRNNILNPEFTKIGVGVSYSNDMFKVYWSQNFAG